MHKPNIPHYLTHVSVGAAFDCPSFSPHYSTAALEPSAVTEAAGDSRGQSVQDTATTGRGRVSHWVLLQAGDDAIERRRIRRPARLRHDVYRWAEPCERRESAPVVQRITGGMVFGTSTRTQIPGWKS